MTIIWIRTDLGFLDQGKRILVNEITAKDMNNLFHIPFRECYTHIRTTIFFLGGGRGGEVLLSFFSVKNILMTKLHF